jgi:hypothetical protein
MLVPDQVCKYGIEHAELLPATDDDHGGVIVDMKEAMDSEVFVTSLRASISKWRQQVVILVRPTLRWMGLLHFLINGLMV